MLHLKLLGPPEASRGGKPLEFRSRREQGLLFYLAAEGGMHSREKLGELLWPESVEGRAALDKAERDPARHQTKLPARYRLRNSRRCAQSQ